MIEINCRKLNVICCIVRLLRFLGIRMANGLAADGELGDGQCVMYVVCVSRLSTSFMIDGQLEMGWARLVIYKVDYWTLDGETIIN